MLCRICLVQIIPRKSVLDEADYTAPTWQHGLDHTDQQYICPERCRSYRSYRSCRYIQIIQVIRLRCESLEHVQSKNESRPICSTLRLPSALHGTPRITSAPSGHDISVLAVTARPFRLSIGEIPHFFLLVGKVPRSQKVAVRQA